RLRIFRQSGVSVWLDALAPLSLRARSTPLGHRLICNICLLTAEENQTIGSQRPRSYLGDVRDNGQYFRRKMARHLLPIQEDSGLWVRNVSQGFSRFLKERTDLICRALEDEAGVRLFRRDF